MKRFTLGELQGQHFAIIGVKGAQPGSAASQVGAEGAYLGLFRATGIGEHYGGGGLGGGGEIGRWGDRVER